MLVFFSYIMHSHRRRRNQKQQAIQDAHAPFDQTLMNTFNQPDQNFGNTTLQLGQYAQPPTSFGQTAYGQTNYGPTQMGATMQQGELSMSTLQRTQNMPASASNSAPQFGTMNNAQQFGTMNGGYGSPYGSPTQYGTMNGGMNPYGTIGGGGNMGMYAQSMASVGGQPQSVYGSPMGGQTQSVYGSPMGGFSQTLQRNDSANMSTPQMPLIAPQNGTINRQSMYGQQW
jgi:hypothetical protein